MRPCNSILSPRGVHKHFPAWRDYREYARGGHADMGAHPYDIAQWCLGMDSSGPVEILPPLVPNAHHGVTYRYANGVVMVHGGPSGCTFTGTDGTLRIDRDHLSSDPAAIVKEPLGSKDVHLEKSEAAGSWGRRRRPCKNFRAGGTILARHDLIDVLATSSSQASLDRHEHRPNTDHDPQGAGTGRINRVKESVCVGNSRGSTCLAMPGALEEFARDD